MLERAVEFVLAFWACVLGGYVVCPLVQMRNEPASWARHVVQIHVLLGRPLIITIGALRNKLQGVNVVDLNSLRSGTPQEVFCAGRLTDRAFIAVTPGSADNLKAVVLTHEIILASMVGNAERLKLAPADVILNWIPLNHAAALLEAHLLPLYVGATQMHVERAALLAQPILFLRLIDRCRVTVAFAPDFVLG